MAFAVLEVSNLAAGDAVGATSDDLPSSEQLSLSLFIHPSAQPQLDPAHPRASPARVPKHTHARACTHKRLHTNPAAFTISTLIITTSAHSLKVRLKMARSAVAGWSGQEARTLWVSFELQTRCSGGSDELRHMLCLPTYMTDSCLVASLTRGEAQAEREHVIPCGAQLRCGKVPGF